MPVTNILDFELTIDKTGAQPAISVTDKTDWASAGIAESDVLIYVTLDGPLGNIHTANFPSVPDIDRGATDTSAQYTIPLTTLNKIPVGTYNLSCGVVVSGLVDPGSYLYDFDFDYEYTAPTLNLLFESNCLFSKIRSEDKTNYLIPNQQLISNTIIHEIVWPSASQKPKSVSSAAVLELGPNIWTGAYFVKYLITPKYEIADGVFVIDSILLEQTKSVVCNADLCSISQTMYSLRKQLSQIENVNSGEYKQINWVLNQSSNIISNIFVGNGCQDNSLLQKLYSELTLLFSSYGLSCQPISANSVEVFPILGGNCCNNLYIEW